MGPSRTNAMIYGRLTVSVLLLMLALPVSAFAQRTDPSPQTDNAYELWRVRSQTITEDLLKDAAQLDTLRRSVISVRLAALWWRDDPRRARTWLTNAVEVVEQVPNRESPEERQKRLTTTKLLLQIAAPLDPKLSKRLITLLTDVDESASLAERSGIADSLINAALSLVEHDPKRALELGTQALRLGTPSDIAALLFPLRARDAKLADSLFEQALGVARQHSEPSLLDSLTYAAFPVQRGVPGQVLPVPDNLRAELLALHAAFLNEHANELGNGTWFCLGVGGFIAPVLPEFDRLLPQQALLVRQTVQKCRSYIPTAREELDSPAGTQSPNTVDALLQAAADTEITALRTLYQYRAAELAKAQRDYDRAIKILDSMTDESREATQGSWDACRWDWAATAALDHFQKGRTAEMNLVLNAVPAKLQPFAKMTFLDRLPATKLREGAPTIQFLNDAGTGLRRSNIPEVEKYTWYFGLLKLTLRYQPSEAVAVLKESLASLNRAINEDSKIHTNDFANFLPASLLEIDEFAVKEALASVTSVEARAQLRLHLLQDTLQRLKKR